MGSNFYIDKSNTLNNTEFENLKDDWIDIRKGKFPPIGQSVQITVCTYNLSRDHDYRNDNTVLDKEYVYVTESYIDGRNLINGKGSANWHNIGGDGDMARVVAWKPKSKPFLNYSDKSKLIIGKKYNEIKDYVNSYEYNMT